jgi:Protein of unknown function (DUF4238)
MAGKEYANKRQHYVAQSYLQAWLDPTAPRRSDFEPFIWLFDKDGGNARRRAPKKEFFEKEMYTIVNEKGERDLSVEEDLAQLEDEFSQIRRRKFDVGVDPSEEEWETVCEFAVAAFARTPSYRDRTSEANAFNSSFVAQIDGLRKEFGYENRTIYLNLGGQLVTTEEYKEAAAFPAPFALDNAFETLLPVLMGMTKVVLHTTEQVGFITTDQPCVAHDPTLHRQPPGYASLQMSMPNLEVLMPVSPSHCLLFHHSKLRRAEVFKPIGRRVLGRINFRLRHYAPTTLVARLNQTNRWWFAESPAQTFHRLQESFK